MASRTLRMLRFRGKRFWLFAAFATFLIFWWSQKAEPLPKYEFQVPAKKVEDVPNKNVKPLEALPHELQKTTSLPVVEVTPSPSPPSPSPVPVDEEENEDEDEGKGEDEDEDEVVLETTVAKVEQTPAPSPIFTPIPTQAPVPTVPDRVLPDRQKPPGFKANGQYLRPENQEGRKEYSVVSLTSTIHWQSQVEHYPVPTESIIQLPTGSVVPIPKIQFKFKDETPNEKINREKRQSQVKKEFQKAWNGYREKAWTHDELSPVSGGFRDPFCGWAATLVDGLDTLYIMGMEVEFEEAVKAVGKLDFTTSPRADIPMFETTIRYLGGLVAAYDVSGKKHKILLDKATELGDILMGAFDTPNRMPVLYYQWTPAYASQPHRAAASSNTAELGSLSLEFTRLAQLTGNARYYDAVARISQDLSDWQDRGTGLNGVFPEYIDASGCNRTVVSPPMAISQGGGSSIDDEQAMGYQPLEAERDVGKPKATTPPDASDLDLKNVIGNSTQSKFTDPTRASTGEKTSPLGRRGLAQDKPFSNSTTSLFTSNSTGHDNPIPRQITSYTNSNFITPSRVVDDSNCKPQGLISSNPNGNNKYGMGGGQDSTYEYMPKQYLLLGGRAQIHGTMYLKTIDAIRKDLLFRPMIPGNRDVLFSGTISKSLGAQLPGNPAPPVIMTPEVEHLTCFIGGMIGMGAKIFDLEGDLELAKKLTDGCVWAYAAFASGIMPEGAQVVPCEDKSDCTWDEETWHLALDPLGEKAREEQIAEYIESKAKMEVEREKALKEAEVEAAAAKQIAVAKEKANIVESESQSELVHAGSTSQEETPNAGQILKTSDSTLSSDMVRPVEAPPSSKTSSSVGYPITSVAPKPIATPLDENRFLKDEPLSPQKRGLEDPRATESKLEAKDVPEDEEDLSPFPEKSEPRPNTDLKNAPTDEAPSSSARKAPSPSEEKPDQIIRDDEVTLEPQADPRSIGNETETIDYLMPLTHKQAVESRIKQEGLPPGFTYIRSRKYILRPEAIESVWYMYRITGDPIWQEKGWKMFEAIIAATSAQFGHSAIEDVTIIEPVQIDEMESFWLAETLKYFYLLFSTPDTISLDDWVLNTEAHPFRRPEPAARPDS